MKHLKSYKIFESSNSDIVDQIKKYIIEDGDYESYEDFIDRQSLGECQSIVAGIIRWFPQAKKCFGEIEVDEWYIDEDGEEQNLMTHHWVEIDGIQYDFSKGTLTNYIHFDESDLYDPLVNEEWRYNRF